jgi:hypothetical protein
MTHSILCSFISATALVKNNADVDPENVEVSTVQVFGQLLTIMN